MDGRNSSGCRVSLLNDDRPHKSAPPPPPPSSSPQPSQLSLPRRESSRDSSASSPSSSAQSSGSSSSSTSSSTSSRWPRTPALSRSNSGEMPSPSPVTPTPTFDCDFFQRPHLKSLSGSNIEQRPRLVSSSSFALLGMNSSTSSAAAAFDPQYPITPQTAAAAVEFGFPPPLQPPPPPQLQPYYSKPVTPTANASFEQGYPPPTTTAPKTSAKKNSYPCPVAKQYACQEYFTTSGHAARHAKKHTGKKDAICPECNKAFTRKDNMEQHRRTHSGVRTAAKPAPSSSLSGEDNRARKQLKVQQQQRSARPAPVTTMQPPPATPVISELTNVLDPALRESPMSYHLFDDNGMPTVYHQQTLPYPILTQRPNLHRSLDADSLGYQASQANMVMELPSPSFSNSPLEEVASPSLAPALDALALAASRQ